MKNPSIEHFLTDEITMVFTVRDGDGNKIELEYDDVADIKLAATMIVEGAAILQRAQEDPDNVQELLDLYIVEELTIEDILRDE